jgi:hypothetical protein
LMGFQKAFLLPLNPSNHMGGWWNCHVHISSCLSFSPNAYRYLISEASFMSFKFTSSLLTSVNSIMKTNREIEGTEKNREWDFNSKIGVELNKKLKTNSLEEREKFFHQTISFN